MRLPRPALTALTALAALAFTLPAAAQKVQVFGGNGQRATTTQIVFGDGLMGGISIDHGQPVWKDSYDGMRQQLKGRLLRLGSNWWSTLTTSFPLDLGGTRIPAGSYLLGLTCDKDGRFALALVEATKALRAGAMPFPIDKQGTMNWQPDYQAPLELRENVADTVVERMTMTLQFADGDIARGSYTLAWGRHELVASLAIVTGGDGAGKSDKDGDAKGGDRPARRRQ
jgi:hypothetical protein